MTEHAYDHAHHLHAEMNEAMLIAGICKALSDPTRLQIMLILSRNGGEVSVCDFERYFDLQQPTISHHLKVLHRAGLVECDRRGLWAYYFVRPTALEPLRRAIAAMDAQR